MNSLSPELQHVARRAQRSGIQAYQKARVMWDKNSSTAVFVEQVTSNEPGFPSTAECAKLASMSHQEEELARILEVRPSDELVAHVMPDRAARRKVLVRRLEQDAKEAEKNWRKVLKALQVLFYLLTHGSDAAVDSIAERVYTFAKLEDTFHTSSSPRADHVNDRDAQEGAKLVRAKARAVLELLRSPAGLAEARQQARQSRKYVGFGSGEDAAGAFYPPPPSAGERPAPEVEISTAGRAHSHPVRSFSLGGSSMGTWPRTADDAAFTTHAPSVNQLPPPPKGVRAVMHGPPGGAPVDLLSSLSLGATTGAPTEWVATTWQEFVSGPPPAASEASPGSGQAAAAEAVDPFAPLLLEQSHVLGEPVFLDAAKAASVAKSPMLPEAAATWSPPSPTTRAVAAGDAAAAGRALSQPASDEQLRVLWPAPGQAAAASLLDM